MLEHPHPEAPAVGQRVAVAAGVDWLRMPLPFALDHINLWLLEDGDGYTIADTGLAVPAIEAAWRTLLAELAPAPIKRIIVTHWHPDHLGLAAWLASETGAPVAMTAGEFLTAHLVWHQLATHGVPDMLQFFRANGLDEARLAALAERGNAYRRVVPRVPATYHRLRDGDRLRIGDRDWRITVGHGHAPEHASLHCAELDVLISGDMLLPRITTNISVFAATPDADNLGAYLASLAAWQSLPDSTLVLPSHGLPFRGARERIAALAAHHAERLARVDDACSLPRTAAELMPVLFDRELDTHQTMFAMGESIAHLNHLADAGALSRERGVDGIFRFQRHHPNPQREPHHVAVPR